MTALEPPLTRRERNRPPCWRGDLATATRLVVATSQPPRPGVVAAVRKPYGATADHDVVRFAIDQPPDEHLISVWRQRSHERPSRA